MKFKYLILATLFWFTSPLLSQSETNRSTQCSQISLEVGKYINTVDEFYGAIRAVSNDPYVRDYSEYAAALDQALQMDQNTPQRDKYNTIQTLWNAIENGYQAASEKDSKFKKLFEKSYERIESQKNSLDTKVKDLNQEGCNTDPQCRCFLSQSDSPCARMLSQQACSQSAVDQYFEAVGVFYSLCQSAMNPEALKAHDYKKYTGALEAAVQMNANQAERAMSNTLKSLWGDIDQAYKYYAKSDSKFTSEFGDGYNQISTQMSTIDEMVSKWKSAGCKDDCAWNCYLGVPGTPCFKAGSY